MSAVPVDDPLLLLADSREYPRIDGFEHVVMNYFRRPMFTGSGIEAVHGYPIRLFGQPIVNGRSLMEMNQVRFLQIPLHRRITAR